MTKFWITKYALTKGIYAVECDEPKGGLDMIEVRTDYYPQSFHKEGRDFHRDEESARAQANKMVAKKIASLKKQLAALEATKF